MATELDIQRNPYNHGFYCFFTVNNQEYYADLAVIPYSDYGAECMIFPSKDHKVTDWGEVYCNRSIDLSRESLKQCVEEFIAQESN